VIEVNDGGVAARAVLNALFEATKQGAVFET
jgi:hypothetical protein